MADVAQLVLAIDSTSVPKAVASLDGLTAAGARAEAATLGLGGGFKGAAAEGTAMAAAAQLSARAAMDQAAGFGAATNAARVNTLAMRESLVVAREISRGNFTRLPGSLTLLAQGIGSQGGIGAFATAMAQQLGLIRQVQNAELAEAATAAATATAGVEAAARRAAANVLAADTEIALAEAQLRVTEGTSAEAAAQVRLAAAHDAVGAAAAEAAVAENALAVAMGRSAEAGAASAAATRTLIGGAGIGLLGIGLVAGVAYGAIKNLQEQIKDDGSLTKFRDSLGLTHAEMLKLTDGTDKVSKNIKELGPVTVTFGDVMHGVWSDIKTETQQGAKDTGETLVQFGAETGNSMAAGFGQILIDWFAMDDGMRSDSASTFSDILGFWNTFSASLSAGFWTLGDVARLAFKGVGQVISDALHGNVGTAASELGGAALALMPGMGIAGVGLTAGGTKAVNDLQAQADANMKAALAQNAAAAQRIRAGAGQSLRDRMSRQAKALKANRTPKKPKKPNDHGLGEALAKLDAEIKGQYALAAAYQISDAAVMRATAMQKAEEDAISHKSTAGVFYEKELQKAVATRVADGEKEAAKLREETGIRKAANDAVAAGTLTLKQATDQMKLQVGLLPLIAAYDNADATHKRAAADAIRDYTKAQKDSNAETERTQALQSLQSGADEIARLRLEATLIGKSNSERAVAIAQLEAMQQYRDVTDPGQKADLIGQAAEKARLSVQTPFQQWARDIPQTAAAITDALQSIEFKGFDQLASGITDVITGTKSLGAAFKDIAHSIISDIIQMTVKMLIFRAVSSIFGGSIGAPDLSSGLGVNLGSAATTSLVPPSVHFAGGGSMIIGGNGGVDNNVLSINGKPAAMVGRGETLAVYPNGGGAANNNQSGPLEVHILVDTSDNLDAKVDAKVIGGMQQAVQVSVQHTNQVIGSLVRPKLNGR